MKKGIIAVIIAVVAVAGIALVVVMHNKKQNAKAPATSSTNSSSSSNSSTMPNMNNSASNAPAASTPAATDKVSIQNFAFSPTSITVKVGTAVTWTNNDTTQHTVTIDSGDGPHSQPLNKGDTYTFTFNTAGTFSYHCTFHSGMTAKVTVTQ
jgi:plastocyanin